MAYQLQQELIYIQNTGNENIYWGHLVTTGGWQMAKTERTGSGDPGGPFQLHVSHNKREVVLFTKMLTSDTVRTSSEIPLQKCCDTGVSFELLYI